MAALTLRLDTRKAKKDGTYPLKVAFSRDGKTAYIPLNISLKENEWDRKNRCIIKRADRKALNTYINNILSSMKVRVMELQNNGTLRTYSDKEIVQLLSGVSNEQAYFDDYYAQFIELIPNESTRRIYGDTLSKMRQLFPNFKYLQFEDITNSWLKRLELMMIEEGLKTNTRSIHLRNIRAVVNAAIADNITTAYPFNKFKIANESTAKRALSEEQLRLLHSADLPEWQRKYVDLFFLGFFLIGINIVDLSKLTEIKDGRIEYIRTKVARTNKRISVKVEPEAIVILQRYAGSEHLLSFFDGVKNYKSISNRLNLNLGIIGETLGIGKFTYYSCRHTWATIAAEIDIPRDIIAQALGHAQNTVTDIYIKRSAEKIDNANRAVIDYFNEKILNK